VTVVDPFKGATPWELGMPSSGDHKTVQARALAYAQETGCP
jgi:hypothetical protein